MTEAIDYSAKWMRGPYTDDIEHIVGTGKFYVGSEEKNEKDVYYLMKYRQKIERMATFAELDVARTGYIYRGFFAAIKKEACALFGVPMDKRDLFTPEQWKQSLRDDTRHRALRSESLSQYEDDLSALRLERVQREKETSRAESDREFAKSLAKLRDQFEQRELDIEKKFQNSAWWITRIRRLNSRDLPDKQLLLLDPLTGAEKKEKTREFKATLQKELMELYNKGDFEAISASMPRFPQ